MLGESEPYTHKAGAAAPQSVVATPESPSSSGPRVPPTGGHSHLHSTSAQYTLQMAVPRAGPPCAEGASERTHE